MLSNCLVTSVFYTFLLFIKQERKANFWVGMEDGPAVRSTCSKQEDHSSDPQSMQVPQMPVSWVWPACTSSRWVSQSSNLARKTRQNLQALGLTERPCLKEKGARVTEEDS